MTLGAKRGDLSVVLESPSGTTSTLLAPRPFDEFRTGFSLFKAWPMMSVHFWGESVKNPDLGGEWTLIIGKIRVDINITILKNIPFLNSI